MPVLKNARHEKFAQGHPKGMTATDAYEKAFCPPCALRMKIYKETYPVNNEDNFWAAGKNTCIWSAIPCDSRSLIVP